MEHCDRMTRMPCYMLTGKRRGGVTTTACNESLLLTDGVNDSHVHHSEMLE